MAEQAAKQEQGKARPQVRRVWVEPGRVFLPDAGRLAGEAGKSEIDAEGNAARAHRLTLTTTAVGVVAQYTGVRQAGGGQPLEVPHRVVIPWGVATMAEVDEAWRP